MAPPMPMDRVVSLETRLRQNYLASLDKMIHFHTHLAGDTSVKAISIRHF